MNENVETKSELEEQESVDESIVSLGNTDLEISQETENQEKEIAKKIQSEIERRFQSAKDKRWAKLEKQYEDLRDQFENNKQTDVEKNELELDILKRSENLLKKAKLSNHPELLNKMSSGVYSKGVSGYVQFLEDVSELILKSVDGKPENISGVVQPGGGTVPSQDLKSLYESARKKLTPGDLNGLTALKRDFRKRGLEIF